VKDSGPSRCMRRPPAPATRWSGRHRHPP